MRSTFLKCAYLAAALTGFSGGAKADTQPLPSGPQPPSLNSFQNDIVLTGGQRGISPLHLGWNREICSHVEQRELQQKRELIIFDRDHSSFWAAYASSASSDTQHMHEACRSGKLGYEIYIDNLATLHWTKIRVSTLLSTTERLSGSPPYCAITYYYSDAAKTKQVGTYSTCPIEFPKKGLTGRRTAYYDVERIDLGPPAAPHPHLPGTLPCEFLAAGCGNLPVSRF